MKKCNTYRSLLKKYIAGEINPADTEELLDHAASCPVCGGIIRTHDLLAQEPFPADIPSEKEFSHMRSVVLHDIPSGTRKRTPLSETLDEWLSVFMLKPAFSAALTVVIFAAGFLSARILLNENAPDPERALVHAIGQTAAHHTSLQQTQDSPYRFTDLSVQSAEEGNLELSFTVSRHLSLIRSKDDPLTKEILAQSLVNELHTADRLQTINYVESIQGHRIQEALIIAIETDPSPAVRLRALSRLAEFPMDPEIRDALIGVLNADESVSMRLNAIDYLTENRIDAALIRESIDSQYPGKYSAVRNKLAHYINY